MHRFNSPSERAFIHHNQATAEDPQSLIWSTPTPWIWRHGYEAALEDLKSDSGPKPSPSRSILHIQHTSGRIDAYFIEEPVSYDVEQGTLAFVPVDAAAPGSRDPSLYGKRVQIPAVDIYHFQVDPWTHQ